MPGSTMVAERRRHARERRHGELGVFKFTDDKSRRGISRGRLMNVSANGAAFWTENGPPPIAATGEMTIYFDGFELVSLARVVRVWGAGFALEFDEADEAGAAHDRY